MVENLALAALTLGACVSLTSCSNPVGPELLGQAYVLTSLNGAPLPHRLWQTGPDTYSDLLADTLRFADADTVTITTTLQAVAPSSEIIRVDSVRLGYELRAGARLIITHHCEPISSSCPVPGGTPVERGLLRGDTLVLIRDWPTSREERVFVRVGGG